MINFDDLVNYAKTYGFVYSGSEIYGGLANAWDYGPLGIELKNNLKKAWWQRFIMEKMMNVGIDSAILMNSKVWEASGHISSFSDPLIDCKSCNNRFRADQLIEQHANINAETMSNEEMYNYIMDNEVTCPNCGKLDYTNIRAFNLMFQTSQGVIASNSNTLYLRPETAQGIFVNYKNVLRTSRKKIPFGIGQIGKSFRNEITPGNFIFRTREFEQMELEFFTKPGTELAWFDYWKKECIQFLRDLQVKEEYLQIRDHDADELSHYANATTDIEFAFPFGFGELWGIASRTDYDLLAHQEHSSQNLEYFDQESNEKYLPYVIEPSVGVDRLMLAILFNGYQKLADREYLAIHPCLAPIKATILPLVKKYHSSEAKAVYELLAKHFNCEYDEAGSIGKRYVRSDMIGTPFCITIDDETVNNQTVTIRDINTTKQIVIRLDEVVNYISEKISL